MKKIPLMLFLFLGVSALMLPEACTKNNPTTPSAPANTPTATDTAVPPTATATGTATATSTDTAVPLTATPTDTATATFTDTAVPPTATPTSTATDTPVPPTDTPTAVPPTATPTATPTVTCIYIGSDIRVLLAGPDSAASQVETDLNSAVTSVGYCGVTLTYTVQNSQTYDGSDISTANYDVVMVWTNGYNFTNSSLGTNLDAYVSAGGNLVMTNFSFVTSIDIPGFDYAGYSPYATGNQGAASGTLGSFDSGSPIMAGVSSFSTVSNWNTGSIVPYAQATPVAYYTDGNGCVAVRTVGSARIVGLNFYGGGVSSGDGQKIMLNSVLWADHKL